MPELVMYDDRGQLTLDGIKFEHSQGRSVLFATAKGQVILRPGDPLPSEADMARGRPDRVDAAKAAIQAQIAALSNQLTSLDNPGAVEPAGSPAALTGNIPGATAIHPDMVGAYPPQRGDGAQPLQREDVAPADRAENATPEQPGLTGEQMGEQDTQRLEEQQEAREAQEEAQATAPRTRKGSADKP